MAANRASLQNWLEVKRKITAPELFSMRLLLSSDNKNVPDIAHSGVDLTQNIMLVLPMEKNITTVKVENGSSYKCVFEIKYRCTLTLPCTKTPPHIPQTSLHVRLKRWEKDRAHCQAKATRARMSPFCCSVLCASEESRVVPFSLDQTIPHWCGEKLAV